MMDCRLKSPELWREPSSLPFPFRRFTLVRLNDEFSNVCTIIHQILRFVTNNSRFLLNNNRFLSIYKKFKDVDTIPDHLNFVLI